MPARKPAAPPDELSPEQIDRLLEEVAILQGQLNQRKNILLKQAQHYGPLEGRGYWVDNRQTVRRAPCWPKLAACLLMCKPDKTTMAKLLAILLKKVGAAGWGKLLGMLVDEKTGLPKLIRQALLKLDEMDADGGNQNYYGSPSINVRKSAADGAKSLLIPLGEAAQTNEPDEDAAIFVDGENLTLLDEDDEEEVA